MYRSACSAGDAYVLWCSCIHAQNAVVGLVAAWEDKGHRTRAAKRHRDRQEEEEEEEEDIG